MTRPSITGPARFAGTAAALVAAAQIAGATDFPARTDWTTRSAAEGLGVARVPLLRRQPGPGAGAALDAVASRLAGAPDAVNTRGSAQREEEATRRSLQGDGWLLQAFGDGTRVRYRNYAALDAKEALARPVGARLTNDALEQAGRAFVGSRLTDLVPLGTGEELVPLFTEHQVNGGQQARTTALTAETVAASTVVFGRRVGGVLVTGPGSKVAVLFGNDGEAVGFDVDWAAYAAVGRFQDVLGMAAVRQRARGLATAAFEAPNATVRRVECGYFDAGARRASGATLQAACAFHYSQLTVVDQAAHTRSPRSGYVEAAVVDVVPAGVVVEPDAAWPQALSLTGGGAPEEEAPTAGPLP